LRLSAGLCAISLLLAPLAGRSALELRAEQAVFNERLNPPDVRVDDKAVVTVDRDPFAAPLQHPDAIAVTPAPVSSGVPALPSTIEVRAVITGQMPHALIEEAGRTRVVQPGDSVAGASVVSIDAAGIRLNNGVLLAMPQVNQ
jgi:hypothetical protein